MQVKSLQEVLALWQARLEADSALREFIELPFRLAIIEDSGQRQAMHWLIDPGPPVRIAQAASGTNLTIAINEENLLKVVNGESNPQALFTSGELRVNGDAEHALRLHRLMICQ